MRAIETLSLQQTLSKSKQDNEENKFMEMCMPVPAHLHIDARTGSRLEKSARKPERRREQGCKQSDGKRQIHHRHMAICPARLCFQE